MDLCVHFGKPAFTVFISSLYLYFGFSNKHFSIQTKPNQNNRLVKKSTVVVLVVLVVVVRTGDYSIQC